MTNPAHKFLMLAAVPFALSCVSCVDDSYDLDDIDLTLGSDVDLTLPTSSTSDILLRNFLNLKDDGVIQEVWDSQIDDTIFCVKQSGTAHIDPVHIDEIRMEKPDVKPFNSDLDLLTLPATRAAGLANETYEYIINKGDVEYTINETKTTKVSRDVVTMESVAIDDVTATLRITFNTPAHFRHFYIDGLTIEMPTGLHAKNVRYQGKLIAEANIDNEHGLIHVTPQRDPEGVDIASGLQLSVVMDRATIGEGGIFFDAQAHSVHLKGAFTATGRVRLETDEIDLDRLSAADLQQLHETGDFTHIIPSSINIDGHADFNKDVVITHFTGDIVHAVSALEPIKLDNMPDFLNDPDVVLDLDNPIIFVKAYSAMAADATTQLTLTGDGVTRQTADLTLKGNHAQTVIALADKQPTFIPDEYKGAEWSRVADLGGLIRKIPDQVDVNVSPIRLHCTDLDVRNPFEMSVDYDVFAPLTAGPDFQLVYRDSERDWIDDGDMDDIDKVNVEQFIITADAQSNVPAAVELTLIPIDQQGNRIKQLEVNSVRLNPNATTHIELGIKAAPGYTIGDALSGKNGVNQLDGITYEARILDAKAGESFRAKAQIQLSNIKVRVKGNVSYDAN